ncbi:nucleoside-diphosphate sugar epimerase/dehydratase, partial [Fulvivirga kasyanovii]|nr:polysaccharide biosynthesis protein [Fulvivirga kasyanovii]
SGDSDYKVMGFVEDDQRKVGKVINGTPIYSGTGLRDLLGNLEIAELIIAITSLSNDRKNEIVDICLEYDVKVRTVPKANSWVKGKLSLNQIKEININDLLGR